MRLLPLFFLLLLPLSIQSQTPFNQWTDFDLPVSLNVDGRVEIYEVEVVGTDWWVLGRFTRPGSLRYGFFLAKLDTSGQVIWIKEQWDAQTSAYPRERDLLKTTLDGNLICLLRVEDYDLGVIHEDSFMQAHVLKLRPNGDTLWSTKLYHPFAPDGVYLQYFADAIIPTQDSGYLVVSNIQDSTDHIGAGVPGYMIQITKLDSIGDIIWQKLYYPPTSTYRLLFQDSPYTGIEDWSGAYIVGGRRITWGPPLPGAAQNTIGYHGHLMKIDTAGQIVWEYETPDSVLFISDVVQVDSHEYVVSLARIADNISGSLFLHPEVRRLRIENGQQQQEIWRQPYRTDVPTTFDSFFSLVKLADNSTVACGRAVDNDIGLIAGILAKTSAQGDSLWMRRLFYFGPDRNDQGFYDLRETADGGFLVGGYAQNRDFFGFTTPMLAWLVKTDSMGCILPGCHLLDAVEVEEGPSYPLKIGPNPSRDGRFGVYLGNASSWSGQDMQLRLYNALGQLQWQQEAAAYPNSHYLLSLPPQKGVYILQIWLDGVLVRTERVLRG